MRNTIEVEFVTNVPVNYLVNFYYYTNPTVNNGTDDVFLVAKSPRVAPDQFTIGATPADTATNLAAALAIDYPTFVTSVSGAKVTITTPNGSPIFTHTLTSQMVNYTVETTNSYVQRFTFLGQPEDLFLTTYDIVLPNLPPYVDLKARFKNPPKVQLYDTLIGADVTATRLNMRNMIMPYFNSLGVVLPGYVSMSADVSPHFDVEINYVQKVIANFFIETNPVAETDITMQFKKNNSVFATITKNMSTTLNNAANVLLGATPEETALNFVNNLIAFNPLTNVEYINDIMNILIIFTGNVKDLWAVNVTANTTGITLEAVEDYFENTIINQIFIPNTVIVDSALLTKVRSSQLLISSADSPFDKTEFQIFTWKGTVFDIPAEPYLRLDKSKITVDQTNIFINVNPYFRTGLRGDVSIFSTGSVLESFPVGPNETKWGKVIAVNKLNDGDPTHLPEPIPDTIVSTMEQYYYVVDGYVDASQYYYAQDTVIKLTGDKRFVERGGRHVIYHQTNHLEAIVYQFSDDPTFNFVNIGEPSTNNAFFVKGVKVDTTSLTAEWVRYTFVYPTEEVTVTYYLNDACNSDGFQLLFKNKHGFLEGFPVTQRVDKRIDVTGTDYLRNIVDVNGTFNIVDHTRKQFNVAGSDVITFNTDWLPEYMNDPLKELMLTEELYILDEFNNALPALKISDTLSFKTQRYDRLIQYTISLKLSHDTVLNVQ